MQMNTAVTRSQEAILSTNKVIKNTYILLSMTLLFSAFAAYLGVISGIGHGASLVASIAGIAMIWFVLPRTANSAAGIPVLFGITGLLGFGLGPVLNYYLSVNPSIVMTALGGHRCDFPWSLGLCVDHAQGLQLPWWFRHGRYAGCTRCCLVKHISSASRHCSSQSMLRW